MNVKGQGAIEYLLILAAAILVVAIVLIALPGILFAGQSQAEGSLESKTSAFNAMKEASGNYTRINSFYYVNSNPFSVSSKGIIRFDVDGSNAKNEGYNFLFNSPISSSNIKPGLFGNALDLNGVQGTYALSSPDANVDSNKGFSISLWIKGNPTIDNDIHKCAFGLIASKTGNVYFNGVGWSISTCIYSSEINLNKAVFWVADGSDTNQFVLTSKKEILDNEWHFVVVTLKTGANENAVLFVDGIEEVSIVPSSKIDGSIKTNLAYISTKQAGQSGYFIGKIDEIIFWDKLLTPSEVKILYENTFEK